MSFFRKTALFSIALSAFLLPACGGSDSNDNDNNGNNGVDIEHTDLVKSVKSLTASREESSASDSEIKSFVLNQYDLNFDLLRASKDQIKQNNAMISTLSLQMAFAMVWAGSQYNTSDDIEKSLNFDGNTHEVLNYLDARLTSLNKEAIHSQYEDMDATEIKISNNLYLTPQANWSATWLDKLAVNYGAGIEEANFAANPDGVRKYINAVVSRDTHDRIKDLLPEGSVTNNTKAVITNAIYFKAPWTEPLRKLPKTPFTKLDNSSVNANFLADSSHYPYIATEKYEAVSLPLRDNDFRVLFILPEASQFEAVGQSLSSSDIDHIFTDSTSTAIIDIKLPAFTFDTSLNLNAPLQSLGMVTPFSPEDADFSKMTSDKNDFFIDQVIQKTFIGLDEKGVEAAAATAITMAGNGMPVEEQHIELKLDHPFYFVIYETKTKSPLFFGRVMDPTEK